MVCMTCSGPSLRREARVELIPRIEVQRVQERSTWAFLPRWRARSIRRAVCLQKDGRRTAYTPHKSCYNKYFISAILNFKCWFNIQVSESDMNWLNLVKPDQKYYISNYFTLPCCNIILITHMVNIRIESGHFNQIRRNFIFSISLEAANKNYTANIRASLVKSIVRWSCQQKLYTCYCYRLDI